MYAVCEGKCSKRFHASCVGLDEDQWNALANNVIWMCDCCMADFCKYRDRQEPNRKEDETRSVHDEIKELQAKVEAILDTLAAITVKLPASEKNVHRHSIPISSPSLRGGTDDASEYTNIDGCKTDDEQHLQENVDSTFELYLSNIDPYVTENDIRLMVSRCLDLNCTQKLDVKRLVSKGIDNSKLDYVSFKIILIKELKL